MPPAPEIRGQSTSRAEFGVRAHLATKARTQLSGLHKRSRFLAKVMTSLFYYALAMSRPSRLILPAVPLHIIQRGNNRGACFAGTTDYLVYLTLLRKYAAETACHVHAYVLMTNHVHLLLSTGSRTGPSILMRRLGQHYVQYFNRTHGRSGTLWEGRFRSCLVDSERYLLICQRYIELNPVRARMVETPEAYAWSSYRANAFGADDPVVTPHLVYTGLGMHDVDRRAAYRHLFFEDLSEQLLEEIRRCGNSCRPLGPTSFVDDVTRSPGQGPGQQVAAGVPLTKNK
nr:transposase [Telluria antibiotica]